MKKLGNIPTDKLNATQKEFLSLLKMAGWTQAEAARQLGVSRATITQILNGKNTPRDATMQLLRIKTTPAVYPQKEEAVVMRADDERGSLVRGAAELVQLFTAPIIAYAQGGEGAYPEDLGSNVPRIPVPCRDPNCYVLELQGNSMEPIYLEGDLLVVAPNEPPMNNDLVVVRTVDDEVLFKRFKQPRKEAPEYFQFESFNPHHPVISLRADQIFKVSVVDCVIRPLKRRLRAMTVDPLSKMR